MSEFPKPSITDDLRAFFVAREERHHAEALAAKAQADCALVAQRHAEIESRLAAHLQDGLTDTDIAGFHVVLTQPSGQQRSYLVSVIDGSVYVEKYIAAYLVQMP